MDLTSQENNLADRRYVTLILRLMLDPEGQLIRGELVDTTDTLQNRFVNLTGLQQAVQDWFTRQEHRKDTT